MNNFTFFIRRTFVIVPLVLILFIPGLSQATEPGELDSYQKILSNIERNLPDKEQTNGRLRDWAAQITSARNMANQCVAEEEQQQEALQKDLDSLGKSIKGEAAEVTQKRLEVNKNLTQVQQRLGSCRVLLLQSDELFTQVNARIKAILEQRLLARGRNLLTLIADNWERSSTWSTGIRTFFAKNSGVDLLAPGQWGALGLLVVMLGGAGIRLRRRLLVWAQRDHWRNTYSDRCAQAGIAATGHLLPQILVSTGAALFMHFTIGGTRPMPFVLVAFYGIPVYFLSIGLLRLLLAPPSPATPLLDVERDLGRALYRRLQVLTFLVYLGYLLFETLLSQSLPMAEMLLARAVYGAILIANLAWAVWLLTRLEHLTSMRWASLLVFLTLIVVLIAEWLGYRNLSLILLRGITGSVVSLIALLLITRLLGEFYDGIQAGQYRWHQRLRKAFGVKPGEPFTGLVWIRFLTWLSLWTLFLYALLRIWDASTTVMQSLQAYLLEGFTIGSLHIIPTRIAVALATIAVLVALGGWLRGRMERVWLPRSHMERGAREALATVTGYISVALAVLIGLGVAGFDFGSLAIIAGALSLGIGFGLQNVVNNFVSGLILLFERPIKTGDWIVVGDTEGYVKRIRIRSTQIQTFDRADVIVPNSDLISGKVTNWMLYNARGRVRVPVGVAYGSNTGKVKEILENIARQHPSVISDGSDPPPRVLFRGFGDSSLDFELRTHIRNIDERMQVISDLNFAIDQGFREAGIEIPFPQRDVHMRD